MKSPRRDGRERREALLDAALRCFSERGVLGTGIEEIRKEAGASPSSVYHLFDGLPGLTLALLARTFDRLAGHLASRVVPAKSAEEAVTALVDAHIEWVLTHRDEARFMYQAFALEFTPEPTLELQAQKAQSLAPITTAVGRFIAEGALPAWSPLLFDVVLLGPSHEACRRWLAGAELDPTFMRATFPKLAWQSVSHLGGAAKAKTSRTKTTSKKTASKRRG
ncbi:Transcriptional regulator, TetR family [Labilithrix luteola]|uniref:Transcriptional regulator, TetR family n=1 Tax=Labilithrix luteola TaxID=1391654 RepID=A0A0K1QFE2_9BACT|nr:TetR/AcrR family transcriptional regulator [Labilithrix luteola]AKV04496.1 Transcriptional regulator, TetR family [Labilithrix luteola]